MATAELPFGHEGHVRLHLPDTSIKNDFIIINSKLAPTTVLFASAHYRIKMDEALQLSTSDGKAWGEANIQGS